MVSRGADCGRALPLLVLLLRRWRGGDDGDDDDVEGAPGVAGTTASKGRADCGRARAVDAPPPPPLTEWADAEPEPEPDLDLAAPGRRGLLGRGLYCSNALLKRGGTTVVDDDTAAELGLRREGDGVASPSVSPSAARIFAS